MQHHFVYLFATLTDTTLQNNFIWANPLLSAISVANCVHCNLFRKQGQGAIQKLLSERTRRQRKREFQVSVQIQCISWMFEFVGFWILAMCSFVSGSNDILEVLLLFFSFVLIPLTYLMNNKITKGIIKSESWILGLKVFFGLTPPPPEPHLSSEIYHRQPRKVEASAQPQPQILRADNVEPQMQGAGNVDVHQDVPQTLKHRNICMKGRLRDI